MSESKTMNEKPSSPKAVAAHDFKLKHFSSPTWCSFCTKFIWGLGKQGYCCKACGYPCHIKCMFIVPATCKAQKAAPTNTKKSIVREEPRSLKDLAETLKKNIEVKDRKVLLKTYDQCFVGKDAVDWFLQHLPIRDRTEGIELGEKMRVAGLIKNVTDANGPFKDKDSAFFSFHLEAFNSSLSDLVNNISIGALGVAKQSDEGYDNVSESDFDVIKTIGKGGFGTVSMVKKKGQSKIYAMKIVPKAKIAGPKQLQCLISEKKIMLNDNPFLVHLHYSFQTEDKLYFVMDYISGGDLAYHVSKYGSFDEKVVRHIAAEIVLALEHLHSCGIIYRDLKLENILLDKDGHVCLTDFGLAKELEQVDGKTNTLCGTPTYLAPEVILGKAYNGSIDWWSLGVVIYELLTGRNPFDSAELDTVLKNILTVVVPLPEGLFSASARDLIRSLLQRDPTARLCSGATGSAEIQNHPFFKGVDWRKLMVKESKAPFIPEMTNNFFAVQPDHENESEQSKVNLTIPGFEYSGKAL